MSEEVHTSIEPRDGQRDTRAWKAFVLRKAGVPYERIALGGTQRYGHVEFPAGFSAHWVRARAETGATLTIQLFYE